MRKKQKNNGAKIKEKRWLRGKVIERKRKVEV